MTTVNVQSPSGQVSGTVELPDEVFDVTVNIPLVHQVVVAQLAAARQGTADTKTRGEVSGGGRKPYRQKGTGRARQGSIRAPQFAGGGTVHGPTPRSYAQRTPKKMKAAALRSALSDRARGGKLHVVSSLVDGDVPSTKTAATTLAAVASSRHVLVVVERTDTLTWKSLRNVSTVHVIAPDQLNTYDVLVCDDLVFTEGALATFLARPGSADGGKALGDAVDALGAPAADNAEPAAKKSAAKQTTAKQTGAKQNSGSAAKQADTEPTAEPAAKKSTAKKTTATEPEEDAVSQTPATEAGDTKPAGAGVTDDEATAEVAEQTSSDLKAEDVFERDAEGGASDTPASEAEADEV
jgi:large subunit ribosomal protein L4